MAVVLDQANAAGTVASEDDATDMSPLGEPMKVFPPGLECEGRDSEALAVEHARLARENEMLRKQCAALRTGAAYDFMAGAPALPWGVSGVSAAEPYVGAVVSLHDLKDQEELNGTCGVVERLDGEDGRWVVRLMDGTEKTAEASNLQVVQAPAAGDFWPMAAAPWLWQHYPVAAWPMSWEGVAPPMAEEDKAVGRRRRGRQGRTTSTNSLASASDSTSAGGSRRSLLSFDETSPIHGEYAEAAPTTTVMMRNLPNNYTREMLLELLESQFFKNQFDFVYLPIDFQTEVGLGYAFINLINAETAEKFRRHFQGFSAWRVVSEKVCEVSWSDALQGIQANVERYRNSPVMHATVPDSFKPMLFEDGKRVPFPAPTKSIGAPRVRKFGVK